MEVQLTESPPPEIRFCRLLLVAISMSEPVLQPLLAVARGILCIPVTAAEPLLLLTSGDSGERWLV